jgi:ATP-binding cassette subfamily F protein 3
LSEYPGTVLLISHDRYVLDRVASRILELEDGSISVFDGNYTYYVTERQRRLERRQQMYAIEQEEIKRLEATLRDLKQWARMNPKFAPRADNMEKRVARARRDAAMKPTLTRKVLDVRFEAERSGQLVVECKRVSKSFGDRVVLRPFDFFIRYGDRVGVVGPNGSGKTTFVKVITGVESADSGAARIGAGVVVGYYAQEQESLPVDAAIVDYIRSLKRLSDQQAIGVLNRLLFTRDEGFTKIGKLSGGEKSRLQIARLMLTEANLLVLDEPTNNLDIASIGVLEQALEDFKGSIVTVSHDRYFLDRTVTRIAEIAGGGQVAEYHGNYSDYLRKKVS